MIEGLSIERQEVALEAQRRILAIKVGDRALLPAVENPERVFPIGGSAEVESSGDN